MRSENYSKARQIMMLLYTSENNQIFSETIWVVVGLQMTCSWLFGSFHGWMRYVTFHDLIAILRSTVVGIVAIEALFKISLSKTETENDSKVVLISMGLAPSSRAIVDTFRLIERGKVDSDDDKENEDWDY